jgi:hypothetical protein
VSKDGIDASLGLTFSLELFKRYQQSGLLQGEIPRAPGVPGRCKAFLQLVRGEVVSVYLEDKQGRRYSSDKKSLCRLDDEKGPFEWVLLPQYGVSEPARGSDRQLASPPVPFPVPRSSIPRVVAEISPDHLRTLTPQQKDAFYLLLTAINGKLTVDDLKYMLPLAPTTVDEMLRMLIELHVISISA